MFSDGFGGYPFSSAIPRGQSFVNLMQESSVASPVQSAPPTSLAANAPLMPTAKRIDYALPPRNSTTTELPNIGESTQQQKDQDFADGSTNSALRTDNPDGSASVHAIRRSAPGADGLQAIRVREVEIDPDGTETVSARVFLVPNGADAPTLEGGPNARLVYSNDYTVPAIPDMIGEGQAAASEDDAEDVPRP